MFRRRLILTASIVAFLSACGRKGSPTIGEAFVGPAALNLRQELAPKSPVVATVKHGDKLEVLQLRRRFIRVRAPSGSVGWTDSRLLLSTAQMDELRQLAADARKLPAQATAGVFEPLNMHTEPLRSSPSMAQIPEGSIVDVVAHRIAPKVAPAKNNSPLVLAKPPAGASKKRDRRAESVRVVQPPMPRAPALPPNWLELSRSALPGTRAEEEFARESNDESTRGAAKEKDAPEEKPVQMEDWNLVRQKNGTVGWVLSRMLVLNVPDELAQYAEGHRITSFYQIADVQDEDKQKHFWLWTTMSRNGQPYEFDSFRLFTWNLRRHRYETAYIERNVKGFYPVEVKRGKGARGDGTTFSIVVEEEGQFVRKTYAFNGIRVSLASREPYEAPAGEDRGEFIASASSAPELQTRAGTAQPGVMDKLREGAKSMIKK
jgi:SH3-like domain-containing protein